MGTKEKRLSRGWIVLVVIVTVAGLGLWFHYERRSREGGSGHPFDKKYTTEEWMAMLEQREYQQIAIWEGLKVGKVKKSSASMHGPNLRFNSARTPLLMHQLDDLLEQDPLMFLPLFESKDPEVIMVGIFVYREYFPDNLRLEDKVKIAAAFRKLLEHPDTRMRWAAIKTLGEHRWLTVEDVKRGLNDGTADIRYSTAFWVQTLVEQQARYTEDGKLVGLDSNEVRQLVEIKRKLAPILVEHLNDTHFWVRNIMGLRFRNLFKRPVKRERGTRYVEAPTLPDKFDWIRADWHTREKTQKEWNSWWTEHGEEALVFAHPPQ